jgi:putative membrane protein
MMDKASSDPLFPDSPSTELATRRTGLAFQRTRLAAERTLMAVIRTSLSLISFGFTIHKVFEGLKDGNVITGSSAGRNFGSTLVVIGLMVLLAGVLYHVWFMVALRHERKALKKQGLVHGESPFPPSMTLFAATLLLVLGTVTAAGMVYGIGPYI